MLKYVPDKPVCGKDDTTLTLANIFRRYWYERTGDTKRTNRLWVYSIPANNYRGYRWSNRPVGKGPVQYIYVT